MNVLGIHGSFWHDPAACVMRDGVVVAAIEEERLSRNKHACGESPVRAASRCLELAGLRPADVDVVAHSWSPSELRRHRGAALRRNFLREPRRSLKRFFGTRALTQERRARLLTTLSEIGFEREPCIEEYEHHLCHGASAYLFSGFAEGAVLSIDGTSDLVTCLFGEFVGTEFEELHGIQIPDSLGMLYSSLTEYLGFAVNDGEYKLMGMAPYGDPGKIDLSPVIRFARGNFRVNRDLVNCGGRRRYQGRAFGHGLVDLLGPPRTGDGIEEPYIHVAAATQRLFEEVVEHLVDHHLGDVLRRTRRLCFAGGCALNVALNRVLLERDDVDALYVPPGPADPGTAVGAAALATRARGVPIAVDAFHPYLGPSFSSGDVKEALVGRGYACSHEEDAPRAAAALLASGSIVGWCQGAMEWGPRALGHRSILGHPGRAGTADEINRRIKFREPWRPFCPAILAERAPEILGSTHPSPYMNIAYPVSASWRDRIAEVVHVDGTARPQIVRSADEPRLHRLLCEFEVRTGLPVVINTSLNRRGEAMVCTPTEALTLFDECGLEHLFLGDFHVQKHGGGV